MRVWILTLMVLGTFLLGGCSREDSNRRERELGRAAYKTKQASEKAAARAAHEINQAGREAREGWNEAKHERSKTDKKKH
jgi:hypothetical protein